MDRATSLLIGAVAVAGLGVAPAAAQKEKIPAGSTLVTDVTSCRAVAEPAARLACYDAAAAKLNDAQEARQLVILDKAQVRETRRGLFGFSLPSLKIFGGGDDSGEEFTQIESKLKSLERDGLGYYRFVLEDGAIWQQTDGRVRPGAKAGSPVVIKKAALGSFFMKINGQPAIRVKRVG